MKLSRMAVAVALTAGFVASAQAVPFDPDGAGPAGAINLGAFDWGPTTIFAYGSTTAVQNLILNAGDGGTRSTTFESLIHARLVATTDPNSAPNTPAGLNNTYEITLVARFTQNVLGFNIGTGAAAGINTLLTATVPGAPGFLEMFYDSTIDSNQLTGSGFNDGRLILTASGVGAAIGNYTAQANQVVALDNAPAGDDDYSGQLTQTGTGSLTNVALNGLAYDPTFFLGLINNFGLQFANISEGLNFISVDPSHCFTPTASGVGIGNSNAGAGVCDTLHTNGLFSANSSGGTGIVPNIGVVNGDFTPNFIIQGRGGPDQIFQTDFNSPVNGSVPEPASLALLGLGLAGMGWVGSRRRKSAR